jgi:putative Mg2+ transporter-C (MgtC) family protein
MEVSEVVARLAAAAAAGGMVGFHFEVRGKPGGLRTHMLTTLAAALFCVTTARLGGAGASEVARMMQGIASGVGFIGGAAVLRRGGQVEGVSNAASLWITAAIGCEAGAGDIRIALAVAAVVAALVISFSMLERRWLRLRGRRPTSTPSRPPPSH